MALQFVISISILTSDFWRSTLGAYWVMSETHFSAFSIDISKTSAVVEPAM